MFFRRISLLLLLSLSLSATSTLAETDSNIASSKTPQLTAQPFAIGQGRRQRRQGNIMGELDLTDAQKNQLQNIRNQYQPRLREKREALSEAYETLREMMSSDTSPSEVRRQHQQLQALRQEMSDLRFESLLELRDVLTSEQREQFAEFMEERGSDFRNRPRRRFRR